MSLADATDAKMFGGKAVQLGTAIRAGLPVPPGLALSCAAVRAVSAGEPGPLSALARLVDGDAPRAVRSSAVDEDSAEASFAGTHCSLLGVRGSSAVVAAVRTVHASGAAPAAVAYRNRMGLGSAAGMAVVVQELVDAEVSGVMFTRNPVTGDDERVIEASWGLGEVVVAGLVTPDRFVLDRCGGLRDAMSGEKDLAIRCSPAGGVVEETITGELVDELCLGDGQLAELQRLALACDLAYGCTTHDIEFAFRDGAVYLLQRRPITRG